MRRTVTLHELAEMNFNLIYAYQWTEQQEEKQEIMKALEFLASFIRFMTFNKLTEHNSYPDEKLARAEKWNKLTMETLGKR